MTCALYLEHYLDSLEHLPIELQRNFMLMRDLDKRAQDLMRNIDKLAGEYLQQVRTMPAERRREQMNNIQNLFDKAKEYGDDKVQLAIQTYELVDKHIRRLDSDLARFEAEIQDKAVSNSRNQDDGTSSKKGRKKLRDKERSKKRGGVSSEDDGGSGTVKSSRKKQKKGGGGGAGGGAGSGGGSGGAGSGDGGDLGGGAAVAAALAGIAHPSDVLDMPVDPNEPTYCLCHQVSYGEMIGCDNPDCPIEWFHFACVGLVTKPKGKWFCPKCTADRKKK
ncbi:inhibitor of growth protein 5 [Schistocerca gregaria]|uniref:inhibitor of growth protein 5 n=1 Tax=Schistocerca gregaria TaxID=7010 RepID=UPI00211EC484|nr:inhibitor of growth protein 5 [Schistocerca gregaria]